MLFVVGNSVVYHKESVSVGKGSALRMFYVTRNRLLFMQRNFTGFPFILYLLFFAFVSLPKNLFVLIISGRLDLLQAFLKGIAAYITKFKTPYISLNKPVSLAEYKVN
jgi:GT2 family glycosyltransferase